MKRIVMTLWISMFLFSGLLHAQDTLNEMTGRDYRRYKKKERKEANAYELTENRKKILRLVEDTTFVLEADKFIGLRGQAEPISPLTNYFAVDGENVVIQFSFDYLAGKNDLGGLTNTGTIVSYLIQSNNPRKPILVLGRLKPIPGGAFIPFELAIQDNGSARFSLMNKSGRQLTLTGRVISPDETATRLFRK
ncbi:MAG: DUF4251 domain-containing protein [Bacteroidales bacterium]|nr:DUF4251 domain-containing protein [Bacteroidales bacterium]